MQEDCEADYSSGNQPHAGRGTTDGQETKKEKSRKLVAGPCDPNTKRTGGVGAICKEIDTLFEYTPVTEAFLKVRNAGRAMHLGFGMGAHGKLISFLVVYGHSGSGSNAKKAAATSAILRACMQEAMVLPEVPKFILGDFNGDWDSFPELDTLRDNMGWTDLNEVAEQWGQHAQAPTCRTANCNEPTIRDYVLACPLAFPWVTNFRVINYDLLPYPWHHPVQIKPPSEDAWHSPDW